MFVAILATAFTAGALAEANLVTTRISVAGCSQPVNLTLRAGLSRESIQPGEFNEIIFKVGSRDFRFKTTTPQVRLKPYPLNPPDDFSKIKRLAIDPTGYFLRGHYESGTEERTLLFFIGLSSGGGSDPESLLIFSFRGDCTPYQIFQSGTFDLASFETNSSGVPVLIGKHSLSQVMAGADGARLSGKPYATTYDPYSVYRINLAEETQASYSLLDSESYNNSHYCWSGPHMSEAKAVVYNLSKSKRPLCMSADRAQKIIH